MKQTPAPIIGAYFLASMLLGGVNSYIVHELTHVAQLSQAGIEIHGISFHPKVCADHAYDYVQTPIACVWNLTTPWYATQPFLEIIAYMTQIIFLTAWGWLTGHTTIQLLPKRIPPTQPAKAVTV